MKSTNIKDYSDIGLNADWCVSTYQLADNIFIFDNEDDSFTLSHVIPYDGWKEEAYTHYCTGTFEECVNYYNNNLGELK